MATGLKHSIMDEEKHSKKAKLSKAKDKDLETGPDSEYELIENSSQRQIINLETPTHSTVTSIHSDSDTHSIHSIDSQNQDQHELSLDQIPSQQASPNEILEQSLNLYESFQDGDGYTTMYQVKELKWWNKGKQQQQQQLFSFPSERMALLYCCQTYYNDPLMCHQHEISKINNLDLLGLDNNQLRQYMNRWVCLLEDLPEGSLCLMEETSIKLVSIPQMISIFTSQA
ncbi:hypothetical protein BC833DRAFT_606838 [Globomyces pollinis-pini]|nr:hypothetical protein BC833DRAFT_606838 [Globomyces pollinis-pini]